MISKDTRTKIVNSNALISLLIKIISILIGIIYIPISIKYLNNERYGLWITISSVLLWASYFNLGLGQGLKNYLSEAFAKDNKILAKEYVSTTYFILSIIFFSINILFLTVNKYIDWPTLLNCNRSYLNELRKLTSLISIFFCFRFVLQIIVDIYSAKQKVAFGNLLNMLGQLVGMISVIVLGYYNDSVSLIEFGITLSVAPVFVFLIGSIVSYTYTLKDIVPSFRSIKMVHTKVLLSIGIKFLLIQLSILVILQTPNFFISRIFGPSEVPVFFVSQKYFSVLYMIYAIFIQAYWPAYTEAYTKKDYKWIKNTLSKLNKYYIILFIVGILMLAFSGIVFKYMTLDKVEIPFIISLGSLFYYLIICYGGIYTTFLAAINKVNLQMIAYVFGAIIFIPLVYFLCKFLDLGILGILIAMIISSFYYFIAPFEVKRLLNKMN